MIKKIICILATYKREDKLIRFLQQFDKRFLYINNYFEIFIADDDPSSELKNSIDKIKSDLGVNVFYNKNKINLGQGINQVEAAKTNHGYQYFWFPGDDDLIVVDEFLYVLEKIKKLEPTIAAFEFKQGSELNYGTNLQGASRVENNIDEIIFNLNNFGKCTSAIIKNPGTEFLNYLSINFKKSMYQDKAMGVYSILSDANPSAYIHTKLTAYADKDFGKIRYSTRVFSNLNTGTKKVISYYNSTHTNKKEINFKGSAHSVKWWWFGIRATLSSSSEIKYTKYKFFKELFWGLLFAVYYDFIDDFQPI